MYNLILRIKPKLKYLYILLLCLISFDLVAQKIEMNKFKVLKPRSIGPAGMSGRITAIDVINKKPEVIYVGTASGGIWLSRGGGVKWEPIFDNEKVSSIGDLTINQNNPSEIWVGTGEGNPRNSQSSGAGIYKSINGGKSWKLMGLEKTRNIHRVIIDPTDSKTVYAGVIGSAWNKHKERGVYKTNDGGKTWKKILYVNESTGVADIVMDPENPNKLIAAMWEYKRWPWFFKSGGKGSGLYITYDGGKNWKKLTNKDGLPDGELGRIGLAIAKSNPDVVYALIESKKNGLYKSNDGGNKWHKVTERNIGGRPFYYAEIYVDPKNEEKIYNLHTIVTVSINGGKNFKKLLPWNNQGNNIHVDHHAWWIHPENQNFLIDGNDGGLAISRDGGDSWRFVENIPVGQFYHINTDMEIPYNIYGGLQDNGSWKGPSQVWRAGGIRNAYWEELSFGDGFDVVPDKINNRYGYTMSQGGFLLRYDSKTGYNKFIKPIHPQNKKLRFNWNAAIAHGISDSNTVYFGSQYLHKSIDKGNTWSIISPDLTTNDHSKQKQNESGGLTIDATNAENYTSIVSIAPSPLDTNLIWVGTDDGNIQLSKNGGKTWNNLSSKLNELPKGSWIHQIKASKHNAGEAYVVANNYRKGDWNPHVYKTMNYGKTWKRITKNNQVWGYALSIVQDPIEPKLLFLGTEFHLYVSIDGGSNWTKWKHGYPTVSTMDMVIHPREHDLVIGTFGRAVFVLDDISPIREVARKGVKIFNKKIHAIDVVDAYLSIKRQALGTRAAGDAMFFGENKQYGAILNFIVNVKKPKNKAKINKIDNVIIKIYNKENEVIRTLKHLPNNGINRIFWNLDIKGFRYPGSKKLRKGSQERGGIKVCPGKYKVVYTYSGKKDSTYVTVKMDPRVNVNIKDLKENNKLMLTFLNKISVVTKAFDQLNESIRTVNKVQMQIPNEKNKINEILKKKCKLMKDSINILKKLIISQNKKQGIFNNSHVMRSKIFTTFRYLNSYEPPTTTQFLAIKHLEAEIEYFINKVNSFYKKTWKDYKIFIDNSDITPFKKNKPFKMNQ